MPTTTLHGSITARVLQTLRQTLGPQRFSLWLGRSARLIYHESERTLTLTLPHRFALEGVRRHCAEALHAALDEAVGPGATIHYDVDGSRFETPAPPMPDPAAAPALPASSSTMPTASPSWAAARHRLEEFIVGPSNQLAYAAAARIAEDDGDGSQGPAHPPLFIHGMCGVGKTHLLRGICQRLLERRPQAKVRYLTGEQFTNDYIHAVRTGTLTPFRAQIRRLDLLAVDDVHFLSAKEKTQQEFLHTFNRMDLEGARVVLAGDCHPRQIKAFHEALVNRCVRGLVAMIHPPDAQTRTRLIHRLAERRGLALSEGAVREMAQAAGEDGSVRELEGQVLRLHALTTLPGFATTGPIGAATVRQMMEHSPGSAVRRPVRFEAILEAVVGYFGVSARQVLGSSRSRTLVLARGVLVNLAKNLTPMSYPEIAAQMGRKGHSTIFTCDKRVREQIAAEESVLLPGAEQAMTVGQVVGEIRLRLS